MAMTTLSATIDENNAGRVDRVVRQLTESSHSQVRGILDHGCVSVNGDPCHSGDVSVAVGDVVAIRFDPTQRYHVKKKRWDDRTFSLVFEDNHIIVVNKSAGTLTVPTDRDEKSTLVDRVSVYLSHSRGNRPACVVHRLDRDVSGLLVFAKHEPIAEQLIAQFKQQKPQRTYTAIVAGVISKDGTFRSNVVTGNTEERVDSPATPITETVITHYRVLKRMSDATLVEATLETGRRNQIRVHFAHAGHPLLGDPRYRSEGGKHRYWIRERLALHASSLGFQHPTTGQPMMFESPLPSAFQNFLTKNR
jgi:23S rRNA pseudouridine1911/1915/1917 synthase